MVLAAGFATAHAAEAVRTLATGETGGPWRWLSLSVFVIGTVLVIAFDRTWPWLWRRFPALGRFVYPDLNGTWEGRLLPAWEWRASECEPEPIPATITVRQTLLTTGVQLVTGESRSRSTRAFLERFADEGHFRIRYAY